MGGGTTNGRARRGDSRARLLTAAGAEFAAYGFGGANVDRIARRARLNKAMIYYHFRSKVGLYREVLREMYETVGARVTPLRDEGVAARHALEAFVATLAEEASKRPYFPRVMLRELADGARHLDAVTIDRAMAIPATLAAILARGVRAARFAPVSPAHVYVSIVGPLVVYHATAPLRARAPGGPLSTLDEDPASFVRHLTELVLASVERRPSASAGPSDPEVSS
jgi:AcrR family transcriptional regulator